MVKMIPNLISPDIKSKAEADLFKAFSSYNTEENFIILHSLGISEHVNNIFGEIDFVVICSRGVLCIEVKGGEVSCENGVWKFTNRYGKTDYKTEGPFQQVQGNMHSLRSYLLKRLGKWDSLVSCQYASCVIMPDCHFTYQGIEIIPEILFDKSNMYGLDYIVSDSFNYWKSKLQKQYGFVGNGLTFDEMERLANLLRGDFHFVPSMKDVINSTSEALCALTDEQYDVLESLADNERTLVSGMAGTGKTWLAMEQARRVYWSGKSVLYLCYNKNISEYVKYIFEKEGVEIDVCTLHSMMLQGNEVEFDTSEFFETVLPERFLEQDRVNSYDYVIVDEGQDLFRETYMKCIDRLVDGGLINGQWLIFYDQNQNLYNNNNQFDICINKLKKCGAASFRLSVNCRNTKQIADANTLMTGIADMGRPKVSGLKVNYVPYNSMMDEHLLLDDLLLTLKNDGICGSDLIILSKYSINNPENCIHNHSITKAAGKIKTGGQLWQAKKSEVRFSTISAFKGLESKVVILIDVDEFSDQQVRLLNYVAVSRASTLLYVFYDSAKEQERQSMMVNNFVKI